MVELVRDNNFDTLREHDKYIIHKNRFAPEANFDFPKTIKHGCNRSCKIAYLSDSFVYSCQDNAVYCIYCVLFVPCVICSYRSCSLLSSATGKFRGAALERCQIS